MNVASLGLCKELFELSGWGAELNDWRSGTGTTSGAYPAYDLGYLLRKLPETVSEDGSLYTSWLSMDNLGSGGWQFGYRKGAAKPDPKGIADTPEDAACKLAIELIKQGVIKPQENV